MNTRSAPTLRLDGAARRVVAEFSHEFTAAEREQVAEALELPGIRRMRITGRLTPEARADWTLDATFTALAVQECVVTLAPVEARIKEKVHRHYIADPEDPPPGETEMGDEDAEPRPRILDLIELAHETLALALPPWPRAAGMSDDDTGEWQARPAGAAPITPEKPFAGLADLRAGITGPQSDTDEDEDKG